MSASSSPSTSPTGQYPPVRSNCSLGRRKSLCLPSQPPPTPIPPSLLKSPYLNSPRSIFQRKLSTPRLPSEEDEHWLQDTVPMQSHSRQGSHSVDDRLRRTQSASRYRGTGDTSVVESDSEGSRVERGRCPQPRRLSIAAPSLPLVDWRKARPGYVTRSSWLAQSHTEPCISYMTDGYFSSVAIMR